ncbi:Dor1-domain-containing protein, partial [Pluteus cervinus]
TLQDLLSPSPSTPTAQSYLSTLPGLPLEALLVEPTTLATHSHHLTSSLTTLTQTSYPTFLSIHKTTQALSSSLESFSSSLDELLQTSLPALEDAAARWKDRTDDVLNERRKAHVVLEQHEKLRDLLDIPILIDACVRNGYYGEALSLANHATALSQVSALGAEGPGQSALLVASVLTEVQQSISQMLHTLLLTLREPNRKLPALWKAVNFLRKVDVFSVRNAVGHSVSSEELIAINFLSGRDSCLRSSLESCAKDIQRLTALSTSSLQPLKERDKEDLARFLKRYIDLWREGVYDIVSQYSTIFLESQQPSASTLSPPLRSPNSPPVHNFLTAYYSYAFHVYLVPHLTAALPHLQPTSLPPLLTQITYCSTAFARVGGDFRTILAHHFPNAVEKATAQEILDASEKWVGAVRDMTERLASGPGTTNFTSYSAGFAVQASARTTVATNPTLLLSSLPNLRLNSTPVHAPPTILASYPPLAIYTNALLTVLNSLRLLAPVSTLENLKAVLDEQLKGGGRELLGYLEVLHKRAEQGADEGHKSKGELEQGLCVGIVYFDIFVPYMKRALSEGVFG